MLPTDNVKCRYFWLSLDANRVAMQFRILFRDVPLFQPARAECCSCGSRAAENQFHTHGERRKSTFQLRNIIQNVLFLLLLPASAAAVDDYENVQMRACGCSTIGRRRGWQHSPKQLPMHYNFACRPTCNETYTTKWDAKQKEQCRQVYDKAYRRPFIVLGKEVDFPTS